MVARRAKSFKRSSSPLPEALDYFNLLFACSFVSAGILCCGIAVFFLISLLLICAPVLFFRPEPWLSTLTPLWRFEWSMDAPITNDRRPPSASALAIDSLLSPPSPLARAEPATLLYRDLEERRGRFERVARRRASRGELILLTSDRDHLPLTLNLVARLSELGLDHHLIIGRDERACAPLRRRGRVACAYSSYLRNATRDDGQPSAVNAIERHWLQRHHYVGRAIGASLNVLLLDSDIAISRSPYPYLKDPAHFGRFHAVVLSDATGSANPLHINGGVWYLQNCSPSGPLRELFRRFDRYAAATLASSPRNGTTFDQQILNEQGASLLPSTHLMPKLLRMESTRTVAEMVLDVAPFLVWRWSCCHQTPSDLPTPGGSYGASFGYRWLTLALPPGPAALAARSLAQGAGRRDVDGQRNGEGEGEGKAGGRGTGGSEGGPRANAYEEQLVKAPPWLFSAESDMAPPPWRVLAGGVRVDSRGWGAQSPPWVLAHFVCSAWPGLAGREQAMRAWGHWRPRSIAQDLPDFARDWRQSRSLMVALAAPLSLPTASSGGAPSAVDERLLQVHSWTRLLVALAGATGRTPVTPALRCSPTMLRKRCVWQMAGWRGGDHRRSAGGRVDAQGSGAHGGGSTCVVRWANGCNDVMLLPQEAFEAAGRSVRRLVPNNASHLVALLRTEAALERRAARGRTHAAGVAKAAKARAAKVWAAKTKVRAATPSAEAGSRLRRLGALQLSDALVAAGSERVVADDEPRPSRAKAGVPPTLPRPRLLLLDVSSAYALLKDPKQLTRWAQDVQRAFTGGQVTWSGASRCAGMASDKRPSRLCQSVC